MKIGDKLYRAVSSNNIVEYTITKIGNKYLYVDNLRQYPIDKNTLWYRSANYSQCDRQYYKTKEEIELIYEHSKLLSSIRGEIGAYGNPKLTIDQLRAIHSILNTPQDDQTTTTN